MTTNNNELRTQIEKVEGQVSRIVPMMQSIATSVRHGKKVKLDLHDGTLRERLDNMSESVADEYEWDGINMVAELTGMLCLHLADALGEDEINSLMPGYIFPLLADQIDKIDFAKLVETNYEDIHKPLKAFENLLSVIMAELDIEEVKQDGERLKVEVKPAKRFYDKAAVKFLEAETFEALEEKTNTWLDNADSEMFGFKMIKIEYHCVKGQIYTDHRAVVHYTRKVEVKS